MKTLKTLVTALFVVAFLGSAGAQDYKSAIGAKLGYGLIASYKTFLNKKAAVDIFGGIRWGGLAAGAYYEIHSPLKGVDKLNWYVGGGASVTTWNYVGVLSGSYYELGVSGVIGLDYTFEDYPVNASVDWAPTIVVADSYDYPGVNLARFRAGYGAFTVRYILGGKGK